MRRVGETLIVAPGRPADVEALLAKPATPYPVVQRGSKSTSPWSKAFSYPAWRGKAVEEIQATLRVEAILTLRNQRGEIVATQPINVDFIPQRGETVVEREIDVEQYTVDILAVMLADQDIPGTWDLKWHDPSLPDEQVDNGLILSALHRSGRTKIPSGCSPCDEHDQTIVAPSVPAKEPITVTVTDQGVFYDVHELSRVLDEVRGELSAAVANLDEMEQNTRVDLDDLRSKLATAEQALSTLSTDFYRFTNYVDSRLMAAGDTVSSLGSDFSSFVGDANSRLAALEAKFEQHTQQSAGTAHP